MKRNQTQLNTEQPHNQRIVFPCKQWNFGLLYNEVKAIKINNYRFSHLIALLKEEH